MQKTLHYFNCFIMNNNKVTNIHLSKLLDEIRTKDVPYRLKTIKQGNICLMDIQDPITNINDSSDRKVVFAKFREEKPFLGNIGTDRIDEIKDDVLELTSIFYRKNSRLLIVEYNHYGMRPNALQNYLNSFLPVTKEDEWSVALEPIEPKLGFTDVSQSRDIKNIEFKVDLTANNRQIYISQNKEDFHKSVLGNILSKSIETHQEFGANFAKVGFSNGRKWRSNVIDPDHLVKALRSLDLESDVFESIKVVYVSPTTGKKETIDLKNHGVLKEVITLDGNGWLNICDSIERHFYNKGRLGENNHLKYDIEINTDLPELIFNIPK